jgi:hypothetical protein
MALLGLDLFNVVQTERADVDVEIKYQSRLSSRGDKAPLRIAVHMLGLVAGMV